MLLGHSIGIEYLKWKSGCIWKVTTGDISFFTEPWLWEEAYIVVIFPWPSFWIWSCSHHVTPICDTAIPCYKEPTLLPLQHVDCLEDDCLHLPTLPRSLLERISFHTNTICSSWRFLERTNPYKHTISIQPQNGRFQILQGGYVCFNFSTRWQVGPGSWLISVRPAEVGWTSKAVYLDHGRWVWFAPADGWGWQPMAWSYS